MNIKRTINYFIENFLFDLTPKIREKIAEIVLAITFSGSLRISSISSNSRKKDKISQWGRYEFVNLLKGCWRGCYTRRCIGLTWWSGRRGTSRTGQ